MSKDKEVIVARVEDVPEGSHIVVEVEGREIGVFNVRNRFYALPNVCTHQYAPLCKGATSGTIVANAETDWKPVWMHEGEIVVCPWHSLEYNITTGECLAYPDVRLRTYEVEVESGQIKVIL
jgi:nitrite reductase/ring-hydroxylating ferredoxin subunit